MLYQPGESVELIADLLPAVIDPYPDELPRTRDGFAQMGLMFRVIITSRGLVVGWQAGGGIQRVDIPIAATEFDPSPDAVGEYRPAITATFRGGKVGPYEVRLSGGCKCGARKLAAWQQHEIFPQTVWTQVNTLDRARVDARRDSRYGLPSVRDTPVR